MIIYLYVLTVDKLSSDINKLLPTYDQLRLSRLAFTKILSIIFQCLKACPHLQLDYDPIAI